jgi:DNA replication protein DnaC
LINGESSEVYSISFFNTTGTTDLLFKQTELKSILTIDTLGTSVAYFIPIICYVVNNDDYNISIEQAKQLGSKIFNHGQKNESYIWNFGAANYRICTNLNESDIETMFFLNQGYIQEASEAMDYRWKKKKERDDAWNKMRQTRSQADKDTYERIQAEYQEIVNAIRGGATTIAEVQMHISKNLKVKVDSTPEESQVQAELSKSSKNPEQAFKEMTVYVKTVTKGLQPGVIICGAPGIGKTFRILQQLNDAGYRDGHNMEIIKGKCTPRQLYLALYNYRDKGEILVIDDADALIGPKAPEECINMLKAALDSTASPEGRKVSYRITGTLYDDDGIEIPKTLYYNGGVIVITNYSVGQLDTALRGRSFVQELDFDNMQLLQLIEGMLDKLGGGLISDESKRKAIDYLKELAESGEAMEISIRTFNTCARLFEVCKDDPDMSDDDVKSMIKEQMKNQSLRGGQKF